MSRIVATLVYSKRVGTMARKAIMAYCADRANDDGSGIWASKQRIADEIECSRQTVITAIRDLVADGLLSEVGRRKCKNGYTIEYNISLEAMRKLPDAKIDIDREPVKNWTGADLDTSSSLTPRRKATLHKPSSEPSIVVSASALPTSVRAKPDFVLPDWVPADAWAGFLEMRKRKRANPTERAKQLLIGKLEKLTPDHGDAGAILDQSTAGGWTDIYELKGQSNGRTGKPERNKVTDNPMVLAFARMAGHIDADGNPTAASSRCDATGAPPSPREHPWPANVALPSRKHH